MLRVKNAGVLPFIVSQLLLLAPYAQANEALPILDQQHPHVQTKAWAENYYRENTACTVANVEGLDINERNVTVTLSVEPATGFALAESDIQTRDNWMALHCPSPIDPVWVRGAPDFDVTVLAKLGNLNEYSLQCGLFHQRENGKRMQTTDTVLSRLKQLLYNRNVR